jgi:transposase
VVRRYNGDGPEAMRNRRYTHSHRAAPLLSAAQLAELAEAVRGPAPEGAYWIGRTVAAWMSAKLGRPVSVYLGWAYLVRLGGKRRMPRPRHVQADPAAQAAFKTS